MQTKTKGIIGKTVYLLGALAETQKAEPTYDGDDFYPCSLIGLFTVDEFHPYEPSAYQWSPGYTVVPVNYKDGDMVYFVAEQTFNEQVFPRAHAAMLVAEREMDFAEEEREYAC